MCGHQRHQKKRKNMEEINDYNISSDEILNECRHKTIFRSWETNPNTTFKDHTYEQLSLEDRKYIDQEYGHIKCKCEIK